MATKQAEAYKQKGNEAFKAGDHAKAIEFYTYATEMDPNNPIFYTNRSFAYFKMGKFDKSLRDAEKSIKKDSNWAKGHYRAGMALMELERYKDAEASFKNAYNIDPKPDFKSAAQKAKAAMMEGMSVAEIIKSEANEHFKAGNIDEAIKGYTEALKNTVEGEENMRADILANRAACNRQLYMPDKVIEDCTEALSLNPNHFKALVRRGQAYESMEKYKKALADFNAANRLYPNEKIAYEGAGRIRTAMKKLGMDII
jgi:tetratricopeptide (TPR) repeat protein